MSRRCKTQVSLRWAWFVFDAIVHVLLARSDGPSLGLLVCVDTTCAYFIDKGLVGCSRDGTFLHSSDNMCLRALLNAVVAAVLFCSCPSLFLPRSSNSVLVPIVPRFACSSRWSNCWCLNFIQSSYVLLRCSNVFVPIVI